MRHRAYGGTVRRVIAGAAALWLSGSALVAEMPSLKRPAERWAVIVGRDEDDRGRTAGELRRMADTLRNEFGYEKSRMLELYDQEARAEAVRRALFQTSRGIGPGDSLLVVLLLPNVGTGEDAAFLTSDSSRDKPWTVIPLYELQKMVFDVPVRAGFIVLTGCQAESAKQNPPPFENRAYSQRGDRGVVLLAVCPQPGDDPAAGRAGFARTLREGLDKAPARGEPLNVATLIDGLREREAAFHLQRPQFFPLNVRPEFEFVRQGGRLDPLLDALASATTSDQRVAAVDALVTAVQAEPETTRAGLVDVAGPRLLRLATSADADEAVVARAVQGLGDIAYEPAIDRLRPLLKSPSGRVRGATLSTLQRLGGDSALPDLRGALGDPDPAVRLFAIRVLGFRRSADDFPALARLTDADSDDVQVAALQAIAGIPDHEKEIREVAGKLLLDPSAAVRIEAASVIGGLGPSLVAPTMLRLLQEDPEPAVRRAIAYSIGRSFMDQDRPAVEKALASAARAPDAQVRESALWAWGMIDGPQAKRVLHDGLKSTEPSVRRTAVEQLGRMNDPEVVPDLIAGLRDPQPEVRQAAAEALGRMGDPRALDALLLALKDENAYVRHAAEAALRLLKGPPAARIAVGLGDQSPRVRAEAARKIGESGEAEYAPQLVKLLADDSETVRQEVVRALGGFKDPVVGQQLTGALGHKDFRVRQGAVIALGLGHHVEAHDAVVSMLKDPAGSVRAEAVRACGRLGWAELPEVLNTIDDDDAAVRLALAETLASVPSARSRSTLQALTRDREAQVRQAAVDGLVTRE
jgi:HEAT repeat protein